MLPDKETRSEKDPGAAGGSGAPSAENPPPGAPPGTGAGGAPADAGIEREANPAGAVVDPVPQQVRLKIVLNAAPDKVYSALTDPEVLRRWFCRRAVVEARAGGKYSVGWAGDYDTDWTVEECAAGRFLYLAKPEPLHFKIEAQNDGRACLSLKTQAHADQEVSARELVLWSTHLLFLKAFLEHGIDLREPDPALEFKEGYVNGAEPN